MKRKIKRKLLLLQVEDTGFHKVENSHGVFVRILLSCLDFNAMYRTPLKLREAVIGHCFVR